MALDLVSDYITEARVLLQDTFAVSRYADSELVAGLNAAFLEAYRLRPDMFIGKTVPSYSSASTGTAVDCPTAYRMAFLYYVIGHAQLRDEEATEDARASTYLNKFVAQLLTVAA